MSTVVPNTSIPARMLVFIRRNPWLTATEIARGINAKLSSVSSVLVRHVNDGVLERKQGGPRGGYVYNTKRRGSMKTLTFYVIRSGYVHGQGGYLSAEDGFVEDAEDACHFDKSETVTLLRDLEEPARAVLVECTWSEKER